MAENWFDEGGGAYAKYRPEYPTELARALKASIPHAKTVLDVGCGTGQLTTLLADEFENVIGVDPSQDQIAHAISKENITYHIAPAEVLGEQDNSIDLITVAQAAHWFQLDRFYDEVRRFARPDALIALISYGVLSFGNDTLDETFMKFYKDDIGPFWPPERVMVDTGYKTIHFPFDEIDAPKIEIILNWDFDAFLGYISTWSATRRARDAGHVNLLQSFAENMQSAWGDRSTQYGISWPVNIRMGWVR